MTILTYQGKTFNQRETDGYVNLGQLCATHGKRYRDWSRLKVAQDYIEALSSSVQISALDLVVTKMGNEGTWGHPLVALEVARWISPQFSVWCNQHIRVLMEIGKTELADDQTLEIPDELAIASQAIDLIFDGVPIKKELVAGVKLNVVQKILPPATAQKIEESRQLLINNTAQKFELLTPTEIGKRIGLSGQAVNKKLCEMGFQIKNEDRKSKKESSYIPIGCGKEFSELTLATGKDGDLTSYQQLRWYSSVIDQIK